MANISKIKLPNNTTYDIKDAVARGIKMYYGTCTTAADTAAKVVTVSADQDFKLTVGALVMVKFSATNTASNVTLNVNSTGAKSIYYANVVYTSTSSTACGYANTHNIYMYNGSYWVWVGHGSDSNTTYSHMSVAEGKTATNTSSRVMRADYLKQIIQYHAVPSGQGVPAGGTAGQILSKVDGTDYNTEWIDAPGKIEEYTLETFDSTLIPATAPFTWFIAAGSKSTASASYKSYMPLLENRVSRGGYKYPACYLFRKIEGGSIYAVFTNPHFTTTFERVHISSVDYWACSSPMPGGSFLFTMSGSTPTLTFVTFSYTNNFYGTYDTETLLTNNSDKIINAHFEANICFGTDISTERSMRVPITLSPNGNVFTFVYNSGGTVYRIICKRTGTYAWTATAAAL